MPMRLKTILNKCCRFKGFVLGNAQFDEKGKSITVKISPRKNSKPICSGCEKPAPGYDKLPARLFEFIPFWGFHVYLEYAMRRVECPRCDAVVVEKVPWADGKNHLTNYYCKYLASWAKEMSWKSVAERFHTSWETVRRAVENIVDYGLKHRNVEGVTALGVDEIQWRSGHDYLTLVYQIDTSCRRLLWVGEERTIKTLKQFFEDFKLLDETFAEKIEVICSDMWKAYLKVIAEKLPQAINVLDRFHIMQKFGKALDKVRAGEARRLKEKGKDPVLSKSRWCFLKRKGNLTDNQSFKLQELLQMNLRTVKAYLLKEQFQDFWEYKSPAWAGKFLDSWCKNAIRSKIDPMKDVAKMLRSHRELILNYFRAKKEFNSGIVEGLNRKINLTVRKAFGFRSFKVVQTALYHQLGELPEPEFTHEFW
jgi:transposase